MSFFFNKFSEQCCVNGFFWKKKILEVVFSTFSGGFSANCFWSSKISLESKLFPLWFLFFNFQKDLYKIFVCLVKFAYFLSKENFFLVGVIGTNRALNFSSFFIIFFIIFHYFSSFFIIFFIIFHHFSSFFHHFFIIFHHFSIIFHHFSIIFHYFSSFFIIFSSFFHHVLFVLL